MVTGRPGLYGLDSGGPGLYGFWAGGPDLYGFGPGGPNLYGLEPGDPDLPGFGPGGWGAVTASPFPRAAMAGARLGKVTPGSSILFLCDMQERFRPSVAFFPQIVAVAARLLQACRELGVPAVVTEQHPRALGPTVPELGAHDLPKHPKTCFSMVVPAVEAELRARPGLASVLLCGIETQACIL
ncbi:isochorismatase domain-containing protein 2-like, partial [Apteryx rowi]|uniref:isochorismatase domain-containing protein 2-like n=1 Tax=Apteryx rowi TaxID=308060 RepID=UPI000E1C455A